MTQHERAETHVHANSVHDPVVILWVDNTALVVFGPWRHHHIMVDVGTSSIAGPQGFPGSGMTGCAAASATSPGTELAPDAKAGNRSIRGPASHELVVCGIVLASCERPRAVQFASVAAMTSPTARELR